MTPAAVGWVGIAVGSIAVPAVADVVATRRGQPTMSAEAARTLLRPVVGPVAVGVVAGALAGLGWHIWQAVRELER